ncbi:MAG: ParA family protein, partial [Hyphomicrobiaceae bacterium]
MATPRLCFINQKGGCGKSSTVFHLGGYFAQLGMRPLLVDVDPQGSLSQGFFGSAQVESLSPS